uniref:Uncharacterized protein n=1 Tax=viral metagenome TaxID=1070528 RepID=A0A6C0IF85_9ZZZZ
MDGYFSFFVSGLKSLQLLTLMVALLPEEFGVRQALMSPLLRSPSELVVKEAFSPPCQISPIA